MRQHLPPTCTSAPQRRSKSSFSTASICTTRRRIPSSASTHQRPRKDNLIPFQGLEGIRARAHRRQASVPLEPVKSVWSFRFFELLRKAKRSRLLRVIMTFPAVERFATHKPVKVRFWPWLEPLFRIFFQAFNCFLLARQRLPGCCLPMLEE